MANARQSQAYPLRLEERRPLTRRAGQGPGRACGPRHTGPAAQRGARSPGLARAGRCHAVLLLRAAARRACLRSALAARAGPRWRAPIPHAARALGSRRGRHARARKHGRRRDAARARPRRLGRRPQTGAGTRSQPLGRPLRRDAGLSLVTAHARHATP